MAKDNRQLAEAILTNIGGHTNTNEIFNCMTRVRINIRDFDQINQAQLEKVEGVMGVIRDGDTLQVVVGPGTAAKVADIMATLTDTPKGATVAENLD